MLLFRSEEHIQSWCAAWRQPYGYILTLQQAWELARAWYSEDRRFPHWRRKTKDEAQSLFGELGLTSEFWSL